VVHVVAPGYQDVAYANFALRTKEKLALKKPAKQIRLDAKHLVVKV